MSESVESVSTVPVVVGMMVPPFALDAKDYEFPIDRERILSDVIARPHSHSVRAVPSGWWARYRAKEKELEALQKEMREFPQYEVSWHARLSLNGETVAESASEHPHPQIPKIPGEST